MHTHARAHARTHTHTQNSIYTNTSHKGKTFHPSPAQTWTRGWMNSFRKTITENGYIVINSSNYRNANQNSGQTLENLLNWKNEEKLLSLVLAGR